MSDREHLRDAAIATYVAGASMNATAREYGISNNLVRRWMTEAGVARPSTKARAEKVSGSPTVYEGGWRWVNGIAYPLEPMRSN